MVPGNNVGGNGHGDKEGDEAGPGLTQLDDAAPLQPVGKGSAKEGQQQHGQGKAGGDDAEQGRGAGQVVGEVAPGNHLHLHPTHQQQHGEPEDAEVAVGEGAEGVPPVAPGTGTASYTATPAGRRGFRGRGGS